MNSLAQLLDTFDVIQMDRELANKGYIHFVEAAWKHVEPAQPFVNSWHIGAICEHLEAVHNDEIDLLVINVPPSTSKSMLCSVLFDPWVWIREPQHKFIHGCYDQRLARRDSLRAKGLIESAWYKERWGDLYRLKSKGEARNTGDEYRTDKGGFRIITTPGGSVTGEHGNTHIIDDPIKPIETMGDKAITQGELLKLIDWHDGTMANRFVDFSKRKRVIIMQRLHEIDLAGVCVERGYEHLCLPMEFEPEIKCFTSIGFEDPRTEEGELLCPERFDQETVDQMFNDLGGRESRNAQAQLQQSPVSIKGDIFKRGLEQYYTELPKSFDQAIQSWDCTFKKTKKGSYVAGQVWGRKGADFYLIDQARDRWSFSETVEAVRYLTHKWPRAIKKLVEDKANGPAIVDHLKNEISGMTEAPPHGDKEARAHAVEPYWSSGNVFLPHPSIAPWIEAFVNECTKFPASKNNDQVDSMTQALDYLGKSAMKRLQRAMEAMNS